MIDRIFHSETRLVGKNKRNWFEGWYFKHVSSGCTFAFIVGIKKGGEDAHAFIQFIDEGGAAYYRFDVNEFHVLQRGGFKIRLGENVFSEWGLRVRLGGECGIICDIDYDELTPMKKSLLCPSAMGIFSYVPFLPCRHAVTSLYHRAKGSISARGKERQFDGYGYIEKDYGSSFPKNYAWLQAQSEGFSIMAAVAYPLILGIQGHICLVYLQGRQYNLSLYSGARMRVERVGEDIVFSLRRGKTALSVRLTPSGGSELAAPTQSGMNRVVSESLTSHAGIYLRIKNTEHYYELPCAFELAGRLKEQYRSKPKH